MHSDAEFGSERLPRGTQTRAGTICGASRRENFDTPPLGRALQSAFSALGLLVEFKPFPKPRALCGALGLSEQEMLC